MFSRVFSGALNGIDSYRIEVEVECSGGMGQIHIVGLPDTSVKESQERVRSAIRACEFLMPPGKKWTVNLAPADIKKEGPSLDLPIAIGILSSTGYIQSEKLANYWFLGELGLDGSLRSVNGVLSTALACKESGITSLVIPEQNAEEAVFVEGLKIFAVSHILQVVRILQKENSQENFVSDIKTKFENESTKSKQALNFNEIKGQMRGKRAMLIAAAGKHNILMIGPPGSGKSMLAQRLPSIMPKLTFEESLELTKLYSAAGLLANKSCIVSHRPFRTPHHTVTTAGLMGGGTIPKPGEISLSHHGILFLDEMTEFKRVTLDALRQPMESGTVTISRVHNTFTYPANFLLVGACNPCPCGYLGDRTRTCRCSSPEAKRYWSRLSGPILDRIDLHVEISRLKEDELGSFDNQNNTENMSAKVQAAVEKQKIRFEQELIKYNSQMSQAHIKKFCNLKREVKQTLTQLINHLCLSARAYDRIIRLARTIADLESTDEIEEEHIAEAIKLRNCNYSQF